MAPIYIVVSRREWGSVCLVSYKSSHRRKIAEDGEDITPGLMGTLEHHAVTEPLWEG